MYLWMYWIIARIFLFQERLAESHREQEGLIQVVAQLEDQLGEVRGQLDQEKHNCRYLAIGL